MSAAALMRGHVLSWFLLVLTTHVATCWLPLPPPESLRGARVLAGDGCQYRHRRTVGIPSRQADCPDSNNDKEGAHALHKVCAPENVSDAIYHLLCTSFFTSISTFCHFISSWNHLPGFGFQFRQNKTNKGPYVPSYGSDVWLKGDMSFSFEPGKWLYSLLSTKTCSFLHLLTLSHTGKKGI